jgi:hypothetical protein
MSAGFLERVGGVLVTPKATLREACQAPLGRGTTDVGWLLLGRLTAGEAPRLARAIVRGLESGPRAAIAGLLLAAQEILPDVLGILIGGVIMSLFLARRREQHALDLAAYAWIPYLAVELVGALIFTALQRPPWPVERGIIDGVAVAWATAIWALGLRSARQAHSEAA